MTVLVTVHATAPGMGKTTLCRGLRDELATTETAVEVFAEEDVLSRPEFEPVAELFARTGAVAPDVLLDASAAYVETLVAGGSDVVITDALAPYLPSLFASGYAEPELVLFLKQLHLVLEPVTPVVIQLDGDPGVSVPRAVAREGDDWLQWFIDKLSADRSPAIVRSLQTAADRLSAEQEVGLRLLDETGWRVLRIADAHRRTPEELRAEARRKLSTHLCA